MIAGIRGQKVIYNTIKKIIIFYLFKIHDKNKCFFFSTAEKKRNFFELSKGLQLRNIKELIIESNIGDLTHDCGETTIN